MIVAWWRHGSSDICNAMFLIADSNINSTANVATILYPNEARLWQVCGMKHLNADSKFHGANMGPTWVLLATDASHAGPRNLAIRVASGRITKH